MVNEKKFNKNSFYNKILVAPLDWGLGHATRCVPIIQELISQKCIVIIAAGGNSYFLLKKEFPSLVILRLYDFKITYSSKKRLLPFLLILQIPFIIFSIICDHFFLKKITRKYEIDAVISDNRFGMFSKKISSVYITHQLFIKTGKTFSEKFLQKLHYYFIKKFNYCWVPDYEENGFAGALSHPQNRPLNASYIGPLSRFEKKNFKETYDILISLSGPEPQRTIFEKTIFSQSKNYNKRILIVRGLPNENIQPEQYNENIKIINHLSSEELNTVFIQSKIVICRSGYTTIMDLIKLGKKAILVPTPGQTEQEYLAQYLSNKKYFYTVEQDKFSLTDVLNNATLFPFTTDERQMNIYKKSIKEFVLLLKADKEILFNQ